MKIVLVGNISNGIGLERDATLLRDFLVSRSHVVALQHFEQPLTSDRFDLAIFLETISDHLLPLAPRRLIFANPEWTRPAYLRLMQRDCEVVLAKTHDAEIVLRRHFDHVRYTGFLTTDRMDATVERIPWALHVGGNSGYRGTNAVIAAWREFRYWDATTLPPLIVISASRETIVPPPTPGITFHKRIEDDAELKRLQNECLFHILPSAYEGWGHAIHEAQSVGAILLTTNTGPMAELSAPFMVPAYRTRTACLATLHDVAAEAIRSAIPQMLEQPSHEIARFRIEARARFERGNEEFALAFDYLLNPRPIEITLTPPAVFGGGEPVKFVIPASIPAPVRPLRIALLGNLIPPHSTESDLAWTLTDMGHTVTTFQENTANTEDILRGCVDRDIQLLIFVHTHGWSTPGTLTLRGLWCELSRRGIKTASFHLDRYWGLNQSDQREDLIGNIPFWETQFAFTADGGNQERFKKRGVNHIWLPPAVVQRDCYRGTFDPSLVIDVGFVGAEGYHPEYPFRGELISFLRSTYGERFRLFSGFRGDDLNNLYASIKVVVGDSCFGGSDYYWSDRVPETLGRGGFLIHPACRGLTIPGGVWFHPTDPRVFTQIADQIDYSLAHPEFRAACVTAASTWCRDNETYHNRMTTLLREVGL